MTVVKKLGRYDIVRTLGKGAMGLVYEGKDTVLQRRVAIKTIIVENLDSKSAEEYESRFRTEALAAARLLHPNIVPVFDFGRHDDIAFLVMQFIEGDDLKHHIDKGERFAPQQSIAMMLDLLSALDHAHENNIVHRDIKPANMLIEKGRVKLTDFGVARIQDPDSANKTQVGAGGIGTPRYMSPEQAQGQRVDARSDLFSAGIVLYELLAGVRPFDGDNPFAIIHQIVSSVPPPPTYHNPRLPKAIDAVGAKARAKNRDERYSSAREFAMALKAAAQRMGGAPGAPAAPAPAGAAGNTSPTSARTAAPSRPPAEDDAEATRMPGQAGSNTSPTSGTGGSLKLPDKNVVVSQDQTVISPETMRVISTAAKSAAGTQPATVDAVSAKLTPEQQAKAKEEAEAAAARAAEAAKQLESLKAEKDFFVARAEAEAKARAKLEEETRQAIAAAPKKSKLPMIIAGVAVAGAIGAVVMFMGDKQAAEEAAAAAAKAAAEAQNAAQKSAADLAREKEEAVRQALAKAQEDAKKAEEARRSDDAKTLAAGADPKKRAEMEAKVKADADARAKAEADARAKLESETRAKIEAEMRGKVAEAESRARAAEAEARARAEAEARRQATAAAAAPAPAPAAAPAAAQQPAAAQAPAQQVARVTLTPSQLLQQAREAEQAGRGAEAIRAYRQAASAGSGAAAKRLTELYSNGGAGVDRDAQQAAFWGNRARQLGEQVEQSAGPCALKAGTTC